MRNTILKSAALAATISLAGTAVTAADDLDRQTTGAISAEKQERVSDSSKDDFDDILPSPDPHELRGDFRDTRVPPPPPPDPHRLRGDFRDTRPPGEQGGWSGSSPDPHELSGDFRDTRPPEEQSGWSGFSPDPHELSGDFIDTRPPEEQRD